MKEMYKGKVNSPATLLVETIDSSVTSIKVADGTVFPEGPNVAVVGTDGNAETIKYDSINGNILVGCVRGFQGKASVWDKDTIIARNFTEYDLDALQENILELDKKQLKDFQEDENHRLVTESEKEKWNDKVSQSQITSDVNATGDNKVWSVDFIKKQFNSLDSNKANKTEIPTKLSEMAEDSTHRTVTDAEKATWNTVSNKVDKVAGKGLSTNDYTDAAKKKVDDIPSSPKYTDTVTTINGKTGAISKADITALGIPGTNTTYGLVTQSSNGLLSAADKKRLDNIREQVALTETQYNALSSAQQNDATKIYFIKAE